MTLTRTRVHDMYTLGNQELLDLAQYFSDKKSYNISGVTNSEAFIDRVGLKRAKTYPGIFTDPYFEELYHWYVAAVACFFCKVQFNEKKVCVE